MEGTHKFPIWIPSVIKLCNDATHSLIQMWTEHYCLSLVLDLPWFLTVWSCRRSVYPVRSEQEILGLLFIHNCIGGVFDANLKSVNTLSTLTFKHLDKLDWMYVSHDLKNLLIFKGVCINALNELYSLNSVFPKCTMVGPDIEKQSTSSQNTWWFPEIYLFIY